MTKGVEILAVREARELIQDPGSSCNRQQLAAAVGVSTKTLQKILRGLVDDGVPNLARSKNPKEKNSWIRAFVRIARHFGKDPRLWIESLGIAWNPSMERHALAPRPVSVGAPMGPALDPVLDSIRRSGGSERSQVVRASLPDFPPFTQFYERFAEHLIGSINPLWEIHLEPFKRFDLEMRKLLYETDACHVIIGIFDSMPRRLQGLDFVTIPGWEVPLRGVFFRPRRAKGPEPTWELISDPAYARDHFHAVVIQGEVGHHFLKADSRYDETLLTVVDTLDIGQIVAAFEGWVEDHAKSPLTLLLIVEEGTCREVWKALKSKLRLGIVPSPQDDIGFAPAYRIGLAIRADAGSWRGMLETARDRTMFGTRLLSTAKLYADVIEAGRKLESPPFDKARERVAWKPVDFDILRRQNTQASNRKATEAFQRMLIRELKLREIPEAELRELPPERWERAIDEVFFLKEDARPLDKAIRNLEMARDAYEVALTMLKELQNIRKEKSKK